MSGASKEEWRRRRRTKAFIIIRRGRGPAATFSVSGHQWGHLQWMPSPYGAEQSHRESSGQGGRPCVVWKRSASSRGESPGDEGQEEEGEKERPAWVAAMSWRSLARGQ